MITPKKFGSATAERLASQLLKAIEGLTQFPNLGRPGHRKGTRELIFTGTPYLSIYPVREKVIEIIRVVHGAQKWQ